MTVFSGILCLVYFLTLSVVHAQETDHTPVIGRKGTRCYDDFNRPQVSISIAFPPSASGRTKKSSVAINKSGSVFINTV